MENNIEKLWNELEKYKNYLHWYPRTTIQEFANSSTFSKALSVSFSHLGTFLITLFLLLDVILKL